MRPEARGDTVNRDQPAAEYVRRSDLMALGFSRIDSEKIMRRCALYRFGRSVYVRRSDALRVIEDGKVKT